MEANDHDLLVRIDERTTGMHSTLSSIPTIYVTKQEFTPVKKIVYGVVGLMCIAVIGSLLSLVIK